MKNSATSAQTPMLPSTAMRTMALVLRLLPPSDEAFGEAGSRDGMFLSWSST